MANGARAAIRRQVKSDMGYRAAVQADPTQKAALQASVRTAVQTKMRTGHYAPMHGGPPANPLKTGFRPPPIPEPEPPAPRPGPPPSPILPPPKAPPMRPLPVE